jgi:hypothetical protein
MDLQFILGLGSFGHWQGGLWLRSLKNSTPLFAPSSLSNKSNNPRPQQGPDDHFRTTVHHSLDRLGAGEMDLQFILGLGSFGHWQEG